MPELPEVEIVKQSLNKSIKGKVINEILIHFKDGTVKSVDISKLMADPDTDYKKLESAIDKQIQKLSDKINHIDWIVDRPKVQNKVEQAKAELYKDKK